jgi:hypothetical protein
MIKEKVDTELGKRVQGVPDLFEGNKKMWFELLLKSPKL